MSALPANAAKHRRFPDWVPSTRKVLWIAAVAFAIGVLLFIVVWWQGAHDDRPGLDTASPGTEAGNFEPLPTPLPADRTGASGMDETPQLPPIRQPAQIETAPVPAPPVAPLAQAPAPSLPNVADTAPQAINSPPPNYPRSAQRRGETGTVLLRVHVSADGEVASIDLIQSSRSRDLDRAASDAVRRWQFRPAMRDGQPVAASVEVPVTFNLGQ